MINILGLDDRILVMSLHDFRLRDYVKMTKVYKNHMVSPIFTPAVVQRVSVFSDQLTTAIQSYQRDLQTGLLEVNLPGLACFDLLFVQGQIVNAYQRDETVRRLPAGTLLDSFGYFKGDGVIRALALTPQAIRLAKILLEQIGSGDPVFLQTSALEAQIEKWVASPNPGLVHICWPGAEALALLPGGGNPPRHTIFMTGDQIFHSSGGMMTLYGWKEENAIATFHSSESQTPAWQEYVLHYAFVSMITHLLSHFDEMAGRILLDAVVRETNFTAAARGWKVNIGPGNVTDQMIFSSVEEAVGVYRPLMDAILKFVESILGTDLIKPLIKESIMRLQPVYRKAFQDNFDLLEYVDVWPVGVDQKTAA